MQQQYKEICIIKLPVSNGPNTPGFGHVLQVLAAILVHCEYHGYYPVLDDTDWHYGKWCDFLEPFWDEQEKEQVLSLGLPIEIIDISQREPHDFGQWYSRLPYVQPILWNQMVKIMKINTQTRTRIEQMSASLPNFDLAIHARLGYEIASIDSSTARYEKGILQVVQTQSIDTKNIFVLADTYRAIDFFENLFGHSVYTLCPKTYDGIANHIRSQENLLLYLTEIQIASHKANFFVGSSYASAPKIIRQIRDNKNSFLI